MGRTRDELLSYVDKPDEMFSVPYGDLVPSQMRAATEALQALRPKIPVLDRRARDLGVDEVRSIADLVPLLFAHTTYKSYPESFLRRGDWKKLELWMSSLSAVPFDDVDSSAATNVDEWLDVLWDAGHCVYPTSGTSGKFSFLDMSAADFDMLWRATINVFAWPEQPELDVRLRMYQLGPSSGPNRQIHKGQKYAEHFGSPGAVRFLSDEPLRMSHVRDAIMMRRAMVEGSAQPDEVAAFERAAQERAARMSRALADLTEDLLDHRNEPLMVSGMWGLHWGLLENARARGVRDGTFNGGSYINGAGGNKGDALPPDFKQQVLRFYANAQPANLAYGMTEMMLGLQLCEADRYHAPPWLILVPLDRNGEQALPQDGIVQSRLGFLDLMLTSRWGGVISGDKVTMDFSPTCSCGRPGPVILPEITRFTDVGDDKITCAGAFEVYVRGMVE